MIKVLIDSSVWIEYFNKGTKAKEIDFLLDENFIVINEIVLSELVPSLLVANQKKLAKLLYQLPSISIDVNWEEVIKLQTKCLKNGLNGIGIPDLLIALNAKKNNALLFSYDKHFSLLQKHFAIKLYENQIV